MIFKPENIKTLDYVLTLREDLRINAAEEQLAIFGKKLSTLAYYLRKGRTEFREKAGEEMIIVKREIRKLKNYLNGQKKLQSN